MLSQEARARCSQPVCARNAPFRDVDVAIVGFGFCGLATLANLVDHRVGDHLYALGSLLVGQFRQPLVVAQRTRNGRLGDPRELYL